MRVYYQDATGFRHTIARGLTLDDAIATVQHLRTIDPGHCYQFPEWK